MTLSHYDLFLKTVDGMYNGLSFNYQKKRIDLAPSIPSSYDLIRDSRDPGTDLDKFISTLPEEFRRNARSELYRAKRGWIDRGITENQIIKFTLGDTTNIVPVLSKPAVGIDSSSNVFVVCCFDNFLGGITYLEKHLDLPKSSKKNEYKWYELNRDNRIKLVKHLEKILNISCKGIFTIHTNMINSTNKLTYNQLTSMIEGCFSGYEKNPMQNSEFRRSLKRRFFSWSNERPIHCDSDFQSLRPDMIVKILVQTLSKEYGKIQACEPYFATLESEKSLPIQLADIIVGTINNKLRIGENPPYPLKHLLFDRRKINRILRAQDRWAAGYYWMREGG